MRLFYDLLFFIFALLYVPSFLWKGKHRSGFAERFGFIPGSAAQALKGRTVVWIHGVSVGEIVLAVRFAEMLRRSQPDTTVVFTTTTPAGREVAEKLKSESDFVFYLPIDFRFCVRRFMRTVQPVKIVILETEIWPNLIWEASSANIPVWILNGRISDKAYKKYTNFRFMMKPVLRKVRAIGAQDARMRERFTRLGADGRRVHVTGNLKFDWAPKRSSDDAVRKTLERMHPSELFWLVAGSTHEGEEEILFAIYRAFKSRFPCFRLAVAPRHLHRVPSIEQLAAAHRISLKKVSSVGTSSYDDSRKDASILLIDSMGALVSFYEAASAAFVGGSLVPVGGHNPVEPAYFEKPILYGPHMENFAEMARVFGENKAAVQVRDRLDLEARLAELIEDAGRREALGRAAKTLVAAHQGAVEKNLELLEAPSGS